MFTLNSLLQWKRHEYITCKTEGKCCKSYKWFKKKNFYFSHEIETFSQTSFMNVNRRKKKSADIPNILKVVLNLREMTFLFQLINISEKIEMLIPYSSTYFVNFLVFIRNLSIHWFKKKPTSNLIAFKCKNCFTRIS